MATRQTRNRQITVNDNGSMREQSTNGPAWETENARMAEVGPFKQHLVTAGQAAVQLPVGLSTGDLTFAVAPRAGEIVGIKWGLSTAGTHTAGSVKASVNGTAKGVAAAIDGGGTTGTPDQTAPIQFVEGDKLGIQITTDANWLPVTADISASLIVRWAAGGVDTLTQSPAAP